MQIDCEACPFHAIHVRPRIARLLARLHEFGRPCTCWVGPEYNGEKET